MKPLRADSQRTSASVVESGIQSRMETPLVCFASSASNSAPISEMGGLSPLSDTRRCVFDTLVLTS